jgi:regulator of protease activity HflC (stomatin/prohibitin superfamily)
MFAIVTAVLLLIAGFVGTSVMKSYNKNQSERHQIKPIIVMLPQILCTVLALVVIVCSCTAIVPTGYTGILTTFGRVEDRTIASGINFIAPWQKVVKMDNRTQKVQLQTSAFSSDIQQVDITLSVNYCINQETAQKLYRTVGLNYYENLVYPRIQENVKSVFAQYSAEKLIESRDNLSDRIAESTASDMSAYGITIISISIEDIDFTDAFTSAVEAKQVAQQNALRAKTEQDQKTMEERAAAERAKIAAQADADRAVIAANADLEVVQIQAEASLYAGQREAEMNQRIAEALTPDLIRYYWIKQWDGELPSTVLSDDGNYMLSLNTEDSAKDSE